MENGYLEGCLKGKKYSLCGPWENKKKARKRKIGGGVFGGLRGKSSGEEVV